MFNDDVRTANLLLNLALRQLEAPTKPTQKTNYDYIVSEDSPLTPFYREGYHNREGEAQFDVIISETQEFHPIFREAYHEFERNANENNQIIRVLLRYPKEQIARILDHVDALIKTRKLLVKNQKENNTAADINEKLNQARDIIHTSANLAIAFIYADSITDDPTDAPSNM